MRGVTCPRTNLTLHQACFHKGSVPSALGRGVGSQPFRPTRGTWGAYLGDLRVGALDVVAGPVEPGAGGAAAVLLERASALAAAPATLKLPVGLEAQAAALPLGCTLVEVDCREKDGAVTQGAAEDSSLLTPFLRA